MLVQNMAIVNHFLVWEFPKYFTSWYKHQIWLALYDGVCLKMIVGQNSCSYIKRYMEVRIWNICICQNKVFWNHIKEFLRRGCYWWQWCPVPNMASKVHHLKVMVNFATLTVFAPMYVTMRNVVTLCTKAFKRLGCRFKHIPNLPNGLFTLSNSVTFCEFMKKWQDVKFLTQRTCNRVEWNASQLLINDSHAYYNKGIRSDHIDTTLSCMFWGEEYSGIYLFLITGSFLVKIQN